MKAFHYLATAKMGEYEFAIAGTIEIEAGQNGYVAVRNMLLADPMYDEVTSIKRMHYDKPAKNDDELTWLPNVAY